MVRLAHHARNLPFNRYAPFKSFNVDPQPGENWRYFTGFAGALTRDVVVVVVNRAGSMELSAKS
jgi:hypothetical protein